MPSRRRPKSGENVKHETDAQPGATWARVRRSTFVGAVSCAAAVGMLPLAGAASASTPQPITVSASGAYIVQSAAGHSSQAKRDVIALGGTVGIDLPIIDGFGASLSPAAASALAGSADVREVSPDAATTTQGNSYNPATDVGGPAGLSSDIGYNTYWSQRVSGQGVGVALIDSGVAPVPALSASGKVIYGPDFTPTGYFTQVRALDTYGHGTFMAGLIAGRQPGATAPYNATSGYYLGVAPDAHIVSVKVADATGATVQSAVIAGIQWVVQHRNDSGLNIKVLNLSMGVRDGLPYTIDPLDVAAEAAWQSGITVVAAAGNDGKIGMTAPANDPYVIAVGGSRRRLEYVKRGRRRSRLLRPGRRNPQPGLRDGGDPRSRPARAWLCYRQSVRQRAGQHQLFADAWQRHLRGRGDHCRRRRTDHRAAAGNHARPGEGDPGRPHHVDRKCGSARQRPAQHGLGLQRRDGESSTVLADRCRDHACNAGLCTRRISEHHRLGRDMDGCDMDRCHLDRCHLDRCDLDRCDLDRCDLDRVRPGPVATWTGATWTGATWTAGAWTSKSWK